MTVPIAKRNFKNDQHPPWLAHGPRCDAGLLNCGIACAATAPARSSKRRQVWVFGQALTGCPHHDVSVCGKEPADIAKALGADLEKGFSTHEAAARMAKNGPNELQPAPPVPAWRRVLAQFQDPLIYLLLARWLWGSIRPPMT